MIKRMNKESKNISEDRKRYLKNIKKNKAKILITQIMLVIVLIVAWEVLAKIRKNR